MAQALILVDIQNDYFPDGKMALSGMTEAAENAQQILAHFRNLGRPVFHIRHLSIQPGATFFLPDSEGAVIHESVSSRSGEPVIEKHFPNSFRQTPLLTSLQDAGVKAVVICGAMSHMCIDATTRAAFDFGLACTVIEDACATRELPFNGTMIPAAQVHGAFMSALASVYAAVITAKEYLNS